MTAPAHFKQRVRERIDPNMDATALEQWLLKAVREDTGDARFICRTNRKGYRLFQFRLADARNFYALIDTEDMVAVTVLPPGFTVGRIARRRLVLKDSDL